MSRRFYIADKRPTPSQIASAVDDLAELLSRDLSLDDAAAAMQVSRGTVAVLFRHLCLGMGEAV